MINSSELTAKIFEFLNTNIDYVVLRNYEGLPFENISRDIDILVAKKEFKHFEKSFIKIIVSSGFKVTTKYKSDKIVTYVIANCYENKLDLVQFDFFFNTSLFGLCLIDEKDILKTKLFNGSLYHPSKEYEFLDKYFQLKFLNAPYPSKYLGLKEQMATSYKLIPIIKKLGYNTFNQLETTTTSKFRRTIIISQFKTNPIKFFKGFFLFLFFHIINNFNPKGLSIGFTGPDGAGKTTVINMVIAELKKVYSAVDLHHFRPTLMPNLGEAAQKAKFKDQVDTDYSNPHRGEKTNKLNSFFRLSYYTIDYVIGYFKIVRPNLVERGIVIFDRYYTDIIADSRRSRIFLKPKFLFVFGRFFIPKLDYNILLTADTKIILKRKQELTVDGIIQINNIIDYLKNKKDYYKIENNGSAEEAVHRILKIILNNQHAKNFKNHLPN